MWQQLHDASQIVFSAARVTSIAWWIGIFQSFGRVVLSSGQPGYQVLVCGAEPAVSAGPMRIATDHGIDAAAEADTHLRVSGLEARLLEIEDGAVAEMQPHEVGQRFPPVHSPGILPGPAP